MSTESGRLRRALGRVIEELEDEDTRAEFEELKQRKVTYADVLEAIREAPPEERKALREMLTSEMETDDTPPPAPGGKKETHKDEVTEDDSTPPPPTRRSRPGRKSGAAYDWYVDDETGEVVRSPVAVVYSGEDEPDAVEMLPAPDKDDTREDGEE